MWDQQIDECAECGCNRLLGEWYERDNDKPGDYWADPDSVQLQPPEDQQLDTLEFQADLYRTCEDCLYRIMENHKNRDNPRNDDGED